MRKIDPWEVLGAFIMGIAGITIFGMTMWLITGCVNPNIGNSIDNRIGQAYAEIATLADTTLTLYQAGVLTNSDKAKIKSNLQAAKDNLDVAVDLVKNDQAGADARISIAIGLLNAVRQLLEQHKTGTTIYQGWRIPV